MTVNAKEQFLATDDAKWFREIVTTPQFKRVILAAWAHHSLSMPMTGNPNSSCDEYNKQLGARAFMDRLLNIAELAEPPKRMEDHSSLISDLKAPKRPEAKS